MNPGALALVGSGEYLVQMQEIESKLIEVAVARGKANRFIQIPTAAGEESEDRLAYWKNLGEEQCRRIGTVQNFLPIFTREDAFKSEFREMIKGAGLIYFSGGDPSYLAKTFIGTPLWQAIVAEWQSGSSLAGCSAGAMAFGSDVPNFRKMREEGAPGLNLIPQVRTIPHYNKFFGWVPDTAAKLMIKAPIGTQIIGIDEDTALITGFDSSTSLATHKWQVYGKAFVHILNGESSGKYKDGSIIEL